MRDREPSEFSRLIDIESIDPRVRAFSIEADIGERDALARRFSVVSIESFVARGVLVHGAHHSRVSLRGHLEAVVMQQCVVSLQAVTQRINADFAREYDRDTDDEWAGLGNDGGEIFLSPDADDLPEPIVGGALDVGEAAAEQLALELDPFPRTPGAKLDGLVLRRGETGIEDAPANPFAALASVKAKLKKAQ